jgi:hypothetical protein
MRQNEKNLLQITGMIYRVSTSQLALHGHFKESSKTFTSIFNTPFTTIE